MLSNFCMMREIFIRKEDNQTEVSKTSMVQKVLNEWISLDKVVEPFLLLPDGVLHNLPNLLIARQ